MSDRIKHKWNVKLQAESGEVIDRAVHAFWSPTHELTQQSVLDAGRIEASVKDGRQYAAISCELVS